MSVRDFRYVLALGECLNFHQAARRCHVTQSTLSLQVRKLEDYLGVRIFRRDRSSVEITEQGHEILRLSRELVDAFDRMRALGSRLHQPPMAVVDTTSAGAHVD
jgi:Transcriptional regulator